MQTILSTTFTLFVLAAAPTRLSVADGVGEPLKRALIETAVVSLTDDIEVPARAAGQLVSIEVREGEQVQTDDRVGQIDDRDAQMKKTAAEIQLDAAKMQADNDIPERYAAKKHLVSIAELAENQQANRKVPGTVPLVTMKRLALQRDEDELFIEKSRMDRKVAQMNAEVHQADVDAANEEIARRQILAPIDGLVIDVLRDGGEWVQAGDVVMRMVRMDRLRVEGLLSSRDYNPHELEGQPVATRIQLARGDHMDFRGKVVFVSPLVLKGKFRVRAEVENKKKDGSWVMRPGMEATMVIKVQ